MQNESRSTLDRYSKGQYQPITFLDRGVSLPFTTPLLMGARLRLVAGDALELVIANPGGGRGSYVMPWAAMPEICVPTLHDRRLWALLAVQPVVTPSAVRQVARQVMREGYAGRAAAAAAAAAEDGRASDRVRANFLLLLRIIGQTETAAENTIAPERDAPERLEARAKRALARAAPLLGLAAEDVAACLEEVAALVQDVGAPGDPKPARARRQALEVETMAGEIAAWTAVTPAAQETPVADVIAAAARLTLDCWAPTIAELDRAFADALALLQRWRREPAVLRQMAARPDWLLDGWSLLCAMWRDAPQQDRLSVSHEIAMLAPILPREAEQWTGLVADWEHPAILRRKVRAMEDWRTGRILEHAEGRERALALAP